MAKRRVAAGEPSLRIADFLALVHQGVSARLGDGIDGFDSRQRFGYVQYYRGDPGVHYEVWAQRKTGRVEVGLHFETTDRDANYAALARLADRIDDVFAAIGPEWELEEWTPQWTRVHRTLAGASLTPAVAGACQHRHLAILLVDQDHPESLDRSTAHGTSCYMARHAFRVI